MSSLPRQSKKRIAAIKSGSVRTQGNSSFLQMTAKEFREGRTLKAKAVHKGLRKRDKGLAGKSEKQKAKDKAWKQFSRYIRLRDARKPDGIIFCCTCGKPMPWASSQACHYVTRAKEATLFNENNVHAGCGGCNMFQGGKPVEYELFMDRKYGPGAAAQMRRLSQFECRRTIEDYERIEAEYRAKADKEAEKFGDPAA